MAISIPIIAEFTGNGIARAKQEFAQLEGAGKKAQFAIKKAAVPAAAALAAVGAALFDATKGAMEDAAAQALLAGNLVKTTGATDAQIKSNEAWIATQGNLLGVTDDELRPALAKLAKATGSVTEAQKLATQAMDIATSTGKPLENVVSALQKAYGGNFKALQTLAPEYRQLIKDGATFEEVMAKIASTTAGAASDAANTAAGKFKTLGVQLDETKESIGAALLPAVEEVLPYLIDFGDWAAKNPAVFLTVAGSIAAIAAAIVAVNIAMALNPITLIAAGIALLIVGLGIAYKKFEKFRMIVDGVFGAITFAVSGSIGLIKGYFEFLLGFYKAVFNGIASAWNNTVGKLSFKVPGWVPGLSGKGFDVPNIPMLAKGGIVNSPTLAMIGEAGPEAVIPLDRMGEMGGGGNVTIHVNGGDPQATVDAITRWYRQNGSNVAWMA